MQLINEEDDLSFAVLHLIEHCFEPFFKFAAVLGAGHQRAHIQRKNGLILQIFGYVSPHDPLCQPFGNGSLANTGFADQHRIVFAFSGQNANHISDFFIPTDDGIHFLFPGLFHKVSTILVQSIIGSLRIVRGNSGAAPNFP